MLRMSRMKDLSAQHPTWVVEDPLVIPANHSAHLRVFPKGPVVSPVVIHSEVRQEVIRLAGFLVGTLLAAFPAVTLEVFPAVAEASTVVAAIDNRTVCRA